MNNSTLKQRSILIPVVLTVIFVILGLIALKVGHVKYYVLERTLTQWDGQHYLSIARGGYEKFPCGWDAQYICGNVGWFPMLPLAAQPLLWLGVATPWAVILTSWLALLLATILLYRLLESQYSTRVASVSVAAMFLFPGSFYFLTAFPNSLYLFLAVLTFYLIEKNRWALLWIPTAALALTHASGAVIGLPLLYLLVRRWNDPNRSVRYGLIISMAAMGVAILAYFSYYYYRFDDFWLYLHFQQQPFYAHEPALPLVTIWRLLANPARDYSAFAMVLFVIGAVLLFYRPKVKIEWQLFMFGLLLFSPSLGTMDSYYRYVQAAFPLFLMVGLRAETKPGRALAVVYAIAAILVTLVVIMPNYKLGLIR